MNGNDAAHNNTRKKIRDIVLNYPGLHLNELSRKLDLSKTTINYHLKYLEKHDQIIAKSDGRYIRYYVRNKVGETDKKIINFFRQDTPYRIILFLILRPNPSQIEISKCLNRHPTTISFHLDKLLQIGMVKSMPIGNEIHYVLKNQQQISELLIRYGDIFVNEKLGNNI